MTEKQNKKKKFTKEWLQGLLWEEHEEAKIIKNKLVDSSRWSNNYEFIFKFEVK